MTGGTPKQVTVFLSEEEAETLIFLQRRYKAILALEKSGALDLKNGQVTMHFDASGELRGIEAKHWLIKN